ncbi:unnamed protein product [Nesidiocoris tenuis]|uniref:Integrase catalytic domain-containing protein n=1 Tax=Nesidiocoris tenuis TaxID=355587 RepID=A0A6H5GYM0_9HEMI|nr:unnamed protein product [Nesidiocoris tenuis]
MEKLEGQNNWSRWKRQVTLVLKHQKVLDVVSAKNAGHAIKELFCDGGGEFKNEGVRKLLEANGIKFRMTVPYTPQQNGAAERENRTLVEAARSMIHAKNLPIKLWAEAVCTAAFVLNRTGPTGQEKSPIELWTNCPAPKIDYFKIFGTKCYAHVSKCQRRKMDRKSIPCILVGYAGDHNGYRLWNFEKNTIMLSRDVIFERESPLVKLIKSPERSPDDVVDITDEEPLGPAIVIPAIQDGGRSQPVTNVLSTSSDEPNEQPLRRSSRQKRLPSYLANNYVLLAEKDLTVSEALESEERELWRKAMQEELDSLAENETWDLVTLPKGKKVVTNRWVLKVKRKPNGEIDRYKARLVAKGYSQQPGVDFEQTFSPVARFETVRALLNVAAVKKYDLGQFDVHTAFLYGTLTEEVYMRQPHGFDDGSGRVCKLKRSLYGLKQSPRCWNQRFVKFMKSQQLQQSKADPCLFIKKCGNENVFMVAIYVDDGILVGDKSEIDSFLSNLKNEFKIKIGNLDTFLGMQIERKEDGSIFVHQEGYTQNILSRFNMSESNPVSTPCERRVPDDDDRPLETNVPYRQAVGSLLFLSMTTRPDLAYAVSTVSEVLDCPKRSDWIAVQRIFKYLNGTQRHGLLYQSDVPLKLNCFTDSDFANDSKTRRSRTGVVTTCGAAAITWLSRKQAVTALSTTEAEYIAACDVLNRDLSTLSIRVEPRRFEGYQFLYLLFLFQVQFSCLPLPKPLKDANGKAFVEILSVFNGVLAEGLIGTLLGT